MNCGRPSKLLPRWPGHRARKRRLPLWICRTLEAPGPEALIEDAELDLREAFRRIGADVQEAPRIWRSNGSIHFRAWVENEERARQLRRAAAAVPLVMAEIHVPGAGKAEQPDSAVPMTATRPNSSRLPSRRSPNNSGKKWAAWIRRTVISPNLDSTQTDLLAAASALARSRRALPGV